MIGNIKEIYVDHQKEMLTQDVSLFWLGTNCGNYKSFVINHLIEYIS